MIKIKHRLNGKVLYTAENAQDIRQAVEEAVKAKANLRSADLRSADLRYADLGSANLRYANLGSANLRSADLRSADLRYADLGSADLRSANLRYADLGYANLRYANLGSANLRSANLGSANLGSATDWSHPLWLFRQDYFSILDQAPAEVATLRQTILDGRIDGSTYQGECSCLAGTIATAHGCAVDALGDELGITTDASRPAEQWFIRIEEGDKPIEPGRVEEWPSESVFRISWALVWLDEWIESRTAIGKVLLGDPGDAA